MEYIKLNIDCEGLLNNGLEVYCKKVKYNSDGSKDITYEPADWSDEFLICDRKLAPQEQIQHLNIAQDETFIDGKDVTPKQYNNIVFFETLRAFRR